MNSISKMPTKTGVCVSLLVANKEAQEEHEGKYHSVTATRIMQSNIYIPHAAAVLIRALVWSLPV